MVQKHNCMYNAKSVCIYNEQYWKEDVWPTRNMKAAVNKYA